MKNYNKPDIFNEEISPIENVCFLSKTNNSLDSFEDDGYGVFEDFEDVQ